MGGRMKFGICNEIFQDWDLEKAMRFAADTGYDSIEIAPFTIAKYVTEVPATRRAEIREMAKRAEIEISGIHWVLVQADGMYLNHTDEAVRKQTADYFLELVRFTHDLGGRYIINGSPKQRNIMEGVSKEQAWEWATDTFRPAVKLAEDLGITICFEPLSEAETNFINTAKEAVEFAKQFESTGMSIILDVKAMSAEGRPIPDIIHETWPDFAYFHANDANLKGPGFGDTDFKPIATALKEVGYDGHVSVEVFRFDEGPEVIARDSLAHLKSVF